MNAGNRPQNQSSPEIRVLDQSQRVALEAAVGLGYSLFRQTNVFLALGKAENQQDKGDNAPHGHCLDPCGLVIAEQLDNRQSKCNGNQSADRSQRHTDDGKHVAFVRIAGHHRGQGAERHIDCGVANSGAQVICHEDVPELETSRSLRHGKQGNRGDDIGGELSKAAKDENCPNGNGSC